MNDRGGCSPTTALNLELAARSRAGRKAPRASMDGIRARNDAKTFVLSPVAPFAGAGGVATKIISSNKSKPAPAGPLAIGYSLPPANPSFEAVGALSRLYGRFV